MGRGIIVQKYIEDPHLIDVERLARCLLDLRAHDTVLSDAVAVGGSRSDTGGGNERALALDVNMHTDMRTRNHVHQVDHKYNTRFWLDVVWSVARREAWLYVTGYIELADCSYTDDLSQHTAHVTNLSRPPTRGGGVGGWVSTQW